MVETCCAHLAADAGDPAPEAEPAGDDLFVDRPHALAVRHAGTPGDARAAARGADDGAAAVVDEAFVAWNQRDRFAERIATHRRVAERAERARPHLHAHVQAAQFIAAGLACAVQQAQPERKSGGWGKGIVSRGMTGWS